VLYDADTPLINERIILDTFADKGLVRTVDVDGDICSLLLSHGLSWSFGTGDDLGSGCGVEALETVATGAIHLRFYADDTTTKRQTRRIS